jgi:hypothetical protein
MKTICYPKHTYEEAHHFDEKVPRCQSIIFYKLVWCRNHPMLRFGVPRVDLVLCNLD